jgi:proteic killer suppression protein
MIISFRHKGLKKLFETGVTSGINPAHMKRIRYILALLNTAVTPEDMNLPGLKCHPLKGERKDTWAVSVSGNWRITYQFQQGQIVLVDYEDYH